MLEEHLALNKNINKMPTVDSELIKNLLNKDTDKLLKNTQAKEIIRKWVEKIEVHEDEIIVNFNFSDNSSLCMVARVGLEPTTSGL